MADIPSLGVWADPRIWLTAAAIIVILTAVMIYFKVFTGEK